ncbi:MAG: hypothetical protein M1814_000402 [Vezdaea aestivalis]|nr:MAG: hypothetical protein M1814_000402 [Vezdaea aestivalis]
MSLDSATNFTNDFNFLSKPGGQFNLTWAPANTSVNISLALYPQEAYPIEVVTDWSLDDNSNLIVHWTPNVGHYLWNIPLNAQTGQYYILISPQFSTKSDNKAFRSPVFTVVGKSMTLPSIRLQSTDGRSLSQLESGQTYSMITSGGSFPIHVTLRGYLKRTQGIASDSRSLGQNIIFCCETSTPIPFDCKIPDVDPNYSYKLVASDGWQRVRYPADVNDGRNLSASNATNSVSPRGTKSLSTTSNAASRISVYQASFSSSKSVVSTSNARNSVSSQGTKSLSTTSNAASRISVYQASFSLSKSAVTRSPSLAISDSTTIIGRSTQPPRRTTERSSDVQSVLLTSDFVEPKLPVSQTGTSTFIGSASPSTSLIDTVPFTSDPPPPVQTASLTRPGSYITDASTADKFIPSPVSLQGTPRIKAVIGAPDSLPSQVDSPVLGALSTIVAVSQDLKGPIFPNLSSGTRLNISKVTLVDGYGVFTTMATSVLPSRPLVAPTQSRAASRSSTAVATATTTAAVFTGSGNTSSATPITLNLEVKFPIEFFILAMLLIILLICLYRLLFPHRHYVPVPAPATQTSTNRSTESTAIDEGQFQAQFPIQQPSTAELVDTSPAPLQQNLIWEIGDANHPGSVRVEIGPAVSAPASVRPRRRDQSFAESQTAIVDWVSSTNGLGEDYSSSEFPEQPPRGRRLEKSDLQADVKEEEEDYDCNKI